MPTSLSSPQPTDRWSRLTLLSVCALAVSVSLGTALVSLSKALLLLCFLGQLWIDGRFTVIGWLRNAPKSVWLVGVAIAWFALTMLWTEAATTHDALTVLYGHARLLWLVVALYLIATPQRAWVALQSLMAGQSFVVVLSWLLWLGVPVSWIASKYPPEMGVAFTSTLEQPVMETLLVVLLWGFRERLLKEILPRRFGKFLLYAFLALTITNIFFVMTGRTGYLVMLVFLSLALIKTLPKKARLLVLVLPVMAVLLLFQFSDRFQHRVVQVRDDVMQYEQGNLNTSQGIRLDNWRVSLRGIAERPWLGHGVGSFSVVYEAQHGHENRTVRDPHQQYLFWWVEGGALGFALLLGIFGALFKDSMALNPPAGWALVCTTAIAATMSLANCPFFGAGMGEFFLVMMASLLGMPSSTMPVRDADSSPELKA
jgi:O-antigen ligase